jgi:hypothetical protein
MDDLDLDRELHDAGAAFRATHTRAAPHGLVRRRRPLLLPAATAFATAAVVVAVALLLPSGKGPTPPTPVTASLTLPITHVNDIELGPDVVALSYGAGRPADRGSLQVRRRSDLSTVVWSTQTTYRAGTIRCVQLEGNWVLWTDFESIDSGAVPGPASRESLWLRNLATGEQRKLLEHVAPGTPHRAVCATAGSGTAAWQPDQTHLSLLDLASGQVQTSAIDGEVAAVLPSGVLIARYTRSAMLIVLRTAPGQERVVHTAPRGLEVDAAGDRLVWFERDPASDTNDGGIVRTCTLPACADVRVLANDPSSNRAVVGSTFAVWSDLKETPPVVLFSGKAAKPLEPGYVPFYATAALDDTLAYCVTTDEFTSTETVTLHVVQIS